MSRTVPQRPATVFQPELAGLDAAIAWLAGHGISTERLAQLFQTNPVYLRQLVSRAQRPRRKQLVEEFLFDPLRPPADPFAPPTTGLRQRLGVREEAAVTAPYGREKFRLTQLEQEVEQLGEQFWSGVRFGAGLEKFAALLPRIGRPSHYHRIRLLARLRQMIAETFLHAGCCASALEQGLQALHLYRIAYDDRHPRPDPADLVQLARTCLLLSMAHLMRWEARDASFYLDLYAQASERAGVAPGAEYYRQRATVSLQQGDQDSHARMLLLQAEQELAQTLAYGRAYPEYRIRDMGLRQRHLLAPVDWDGAQELVAYMRSQVPMGEIHLGLNVNWAAAVGYSTDSAAVQQEATALLDRCRNTTDGYGHQATVTRLLLLTPDLPVAVRPHWARYVLYQNAMRNR